MNGTLKSTADKMSIYKFYGPQFKKYQAPLEIVLHILKKDKVGIGFQNAKKWYIQPKNLIRRVYSLNSVLFWTCQPDYKKIPIYNKPQICKI